MARMPFHRPLGAEQRINRDAHPYVPCACCGNGLAHYALRDYVRVVDLGASIATRDEPEPAHRDMGFRPICIDCVRSIPRPFRFDCQDARGGF